MVISCFWAAVMGAQIRHLYMMGLSAEELVFYRNAVALVLLLPWVLRYGRGELFKTRRLGLYGLRSLIGLIAMYLWFYALVSIPLADATALSFTAPLFSALLAVFFLKDKMGRHRVAAMVIGFVGVLLVLRPGSEAFQADAIIALCAASGWAFSTIFIKMLTKTDKPRIVVFFMVLFMTPMSLPLALPYLHVMSLEIWGWIILLGIISNLFQISLSNAIALTDISVILPFDFLRLVFISIIAYFAFGEVVDIWSYIGGAVILCGAAYSAYREALQRKQQKALYGTP